MGPPSLRPRKQSLFYLGREKELAVLPRFAIMTNMVNGEKECSSSTINELSIEKAQCESAGLIAYFNYCREAKG